MEGVTTMNKRQLIKYISAFAMGDGGVYYSGKDCRFVANQIEENRDYIEWRADVLSNLTKVNLHISKQEGKKPLLCTTTRAHPVYTKVRERLYIGAYKSVDPHYLKLLDWDMLAILYQDDGSLNRDSRCDSVDVRLNTKRLSYGDSLLLKQALKEKLELEFNINRHYNRYFLRLRTKDNEAFFDNVSPHIFESFKYKLP
jgi:hypothetical protein